MDGCVIKHDQSGLLHPLAIVIKTLDQDLAIDRAIEDVRLERSVEVEKAQDIEPRRMKAWDFQGLSTKLPGVRHARDHTETRSIEIDQVEIAIGAGASFSQFAQMSFGGLKILFIPFAARGTPHPFPDVIVVL